MRFSLKHGLLAFTLVGILIGVLFSRSWLLMTIMTVLVLTSILCAVAVAMLLKPGRAREFYQGFSILAVGTLILSVMFPASYEGVASATALPLLLASQPPGARTTTSYAPTTTLPSLGPAPIGTLYPTYQPALTSTPTTIPPAPVAIPSIPYPMVQQARHYVTAALAFMLGMAGGFLGLLLRPASADQNPAVSPAATRDDMETSVLIPHTPHHGTPSPKGSSRVVRFDRE